MRDLLRSINNLSRGRKLVVYSLILINLLTWLAICLVLASYLAA
jgi:hypothetical protein